MHWIGLALACAMMTPAVTSACDAYTGPPGFSIQANPADTVPPSIPEVVVLYVSRSDRERDGCSKGKCGGLSFVEFGLTADDDVSAADALGFKIEGDSLLGDGQVFTAPDGRVRVLLDLNDDGERDLHFPVKVAAVDEAGNVSGTTEVEVRSEGDGCQLARGMSNAWWVALALGLNRVRRPARGRRTRGEAGCRP